jgi:thymidylate synthase (FAD)
MSPDSFNEINKMPLEKVEEELKYVFGTIASSWEFVDYVFLLTGVSRAFTHELVRTRQASYAQQSMRAVNMEDFDYVSTGKCTDGNIGESVYNICMDDIKGYYSTLIGLGVDIQDARGVLPTNVCTNIMMKINLRALSNLMNDRLCFRAAGEYQEVAKQMKERVLEVHPWAKPVLRVNCVQHGFCKFKNFKECPMKTQGLIKEVDSEMLEKEWSKIKMVAQPKVEKK